MKFHGLIHFSLDMLLFGVPLEFDTSANESHHKVSKQGAKLTQKAAKTFNLQTAHRMTEFRLIELAMLEIEKGAVVWDYFAGCTEEEPRDMEGASEEESMDDDCSGATSSSDSKCEENEMEVETGKRKKKAGIEIHTGDSRIVVFQGDDGEAEFKIISRSKHVQKTRLHQSLVVFLRDLQVLISDVLLGNSLPIFTCHTRGDQIFRAHPNYRGKGAGGTGFGLIGEPKGDFHATSGALWC
jgi:hypothetical protein